MNPGPSCNKNCLKIFDSSHIPEFVFSPRSFSWPSVAVLNTSAMIFIEKNVPLDSKYKKSTTLIFLRKPGELLRLLDSCIFCRWSLIILKKSCSLCTSIEKAYVAFPMVRIFLIEELGHESGRTLVYSE